MIETILRLAEDNLTYVEALVSDIEDSQMAQQPGGLVNHPAWTLGHLVVSQDFALQLLEAPSAADPSWVRLFGSGGTPTDDRLNFPAKTELLTALRMEHDKVANAFRENFERRASATNPFAPLVPRFPTIGDLVMHLMTTHEASHLGQLSAWRRAQGMPAVSVVPKSAVEIKPDTPLVASGEKEVAEPVKAAAATKATTKPAPTPATSVPAPVAEEREMTIAPEAPIVVTD